MSNKDREDVQSFFDSFLKPKAELLSGNALENRLKQISKKLILFKVLRVILFIAMFASFFFGVTKIGPLVGMLLILPYLIVIFIISIKMIIADNEKKQLIGTNVVSRVIAHEFNIIEYDALKFIDRDEIEAAALIDNWNSCHGSDFIHGKYKGLTFTLSDILLTFNDKGDDAGPPRTKFKGQWFICELNQNLNTKLRLFERSSEGKGKKSDVETGNKIFNDKYRILTSDPKMASEILTPYFMEYIINMDNVAKAQTYICFMDNKVHFAFYNNRNLFEANDRKVIGGMGVDQLRSQIKQEVEYTTTIMDTLLLNEFLFKK